MEEAFWASKASFYNRFRKLYLPLLFIGAIGLTTPVLLKSETVQATPVNKVTKVSYSDTFSSGNSSAGINTSDSLAVPGCSPDTGFQTAGPISAGQQTGLIQLTDPIYGHKMFGYTADQLASLSQQCPLIISGDNEPFINAYTSYWIGWRFDYQPGDDGLCRVSNATVLLRIHQALPVWANYGGANPALKQQWQNYLTAVTTHENGHVQLIQESAAQLLQAMRTLKPTACSQIETTVNQTGQAYLAQLAQANQNYDLQTRHGVTQGAIVP